MQKNNQLMVQYPLFQQPPKRSVLETIYRWLIRTSVHPITAFAIGLGVAYEARAPFLGLAVSLIFLLLNQLRLGMHMLHTAISRVSHQAWADKVIAQAKAAMGHSHNPNSPMQPPTPSIDADPNWGKRKDEGEDDVTP